MLTIEIKQHGPIEITDGKHRGYTCTVPVIVNDEEQTFTLYRHDYYSPELDGNSIKDMEEKFPGGLKYNFSAIEEMFKEMIDDRMAKEKAERKKKEKEARSLAYDNSYLHKVFDEIDELENVKQTFITSKKEYLEKEFMGISILVHTTKNFTIDICPHSYKNGYFSRINVPKGITAHHSKLHNETSARSIKGIVRFVKGEIAGCKWILEGSNALTSGIDKGLDALTTSTGRKITSKTEDKYSYYGSKRPTYMGKETTFHIEMKNPPFGIKFDKEKDEVSFRIGGLPISKLSEILAILEK